MDVIHPGIMLRFLVATMCPRTSESVPQHKHLFIPKLLYMYSTLNVCSICLYVGTTGFLSR